MTGRKRRRAPPSVPGGLLDWTDSSLWSCTANPCRSCANDTNLRDSKRSPAHKTCAETALAQQAAEAVDIYQNGTL
jgi:hypothetical protein